MNKFLKLLVAIFITSSIHGQITTQNVQSPAQVIQNNLLGAGITVSNITYNGSPVDATNLQSNVATFDATGTTFPVQSGVLLTTGLAIGAEGPNSGGATTNGGTPIVNDVDLDAIAASSVTNGVVLEFDFVPTGDTLSFEYVFGSDEYPEFSPSTFNDVFGFFLSGPGINGPFSNNAENLAIVPGTTTPVTINNVGPGSNQAFYVDNVNGAAYGSAIEYDGTTVTLTANASLQCGETYHIKLGIANVGDQSYDSGVFLEANSFSSNVVDINIESTTSTLDTLLIEGCTEGNIYFTRPSNQTDDSLTVFFDVTGTADQIDDFPVLAPGDSVTFLPGEDSLVLTISPIQDNISEGFESLIVSAFTVTECGDTVFSQGTIWIADEPFSTVTALDTTILCANDSVPTWATTSGGFPPYSYSWSNGEVGDTVPTAGLIDGPTDYIVVSTDACGFEYIDTATIDLNQTLAVDTLLQFPSECGLETGALSGQGTGITGTPLYEWSGPGANNTNSINATVWQDLPSGWYYFTIQDDVCFVEDSIFLEQDPPPTADFTANPPIGYAPLNVDFTNNSDPADTYEWNFGNGDSITVNNLDSQNSTYNDVGVYTVTLTITDGACSDQATQTVIVEELIPLLPLDYDMPNVFTPNNDGSNDVFTLNTENATSLELVILNRWGNVVFESTNDVDAAWNGKVQNGGQECNDGTYFYKFIITGEDGVEIEEHGFVQLVRD